MSKFTSLAEAVQANLHEGDTVAFEGFMHLIPHAAVHEAIRQGISDLTLLRMTPDIVYDQIIGMGLARKVIFSYAGNPGVGLLRRMRDAIKNQYSRAIETVEHSHAAMANAYEAGASGLPLAVFRGYKGPTCRRSIPTSNQWFARLPAKCWRPFPRTGQMSRLSTPRRLAQKAMC